ncbi:hypothetical protein N5079_11700 [Planotetraspora sp. A-T 1434]|uniref:hypothetical protein n=1 Tax=Planotetraspora sp. A-T 1434 TaxID=2979219 RepID=UPI0021BFACC3|nr:hypothetical protein [Planotetraspora sp. A-T 1434]MCT9930883.1 hypothetical protein [Planotetraspora sp. A-T 1434]
MERQAGAGEHGARRSPGGDHMRMTTRTTTGMTTSTITGVSTGMSTGMSTGTARRRMSVR